VKLIINCCNISSKGGIQVAISFINECVSYPENEYHAFVNNEIFLQIDQNEFPGNFHFYIIEHSPSSLKYGFKTIRKLKLLEKEIKPDCVFTVFGSSYWTPRSIHLMGFAMGHNIYPEYFAKINFQFREKCLFIFRRYLHTFLFKLNAGYYYTENADVSKRLAKLLRVSENRVFTIGNTYSHVFEEPWESTAILPPKGENEFRLITITTYYTHKNLEIIRKVIPYLSLSDLKIRFILTLPEDIFSSKFSDCNEYILNLGPVPLKHCPFLYANSDALFLPTLLECFSASYPEAMKMNRPVLTSNLPFALSICGPAAEYFDPFDPEDIAKKILNLASDKARQAELARLGNEQLRMFETPGSRAKKLLDICASISNC
jgi:glycosyltransferase involved in cell wall biosynthesis